MSMTPPRPEGEQDDANQRNDEPPRLDERRALVRRLFQQEAPATAQDR